MTTKNIVIVLDPQDLMETPINYVHSQAFADIVKNVERQMGEEDLSYRLIFVRDKDDEI